MPATGRIGQQVTGRLVTSKNKVGLLLASTGTTVYLRYALVLRESDQLLFPESLIDDWGHEIRDLSLFKWLQENGDRFPRAEIFGYDTKGLPIQRFVRELELDANYPCYAYAHVRSPIASGVSVESVFLASNQVKGPKPVRPPSYISGPLKRADVVWQAVDPTCLDSYKFDIA